jgi:hypothetical protein
VKRDPNSLVRIWLEGALNSLFKKSYLIPLYPPLSKGGNIFSSLWQRDVACLREAASAKAGEGFSKIYFKPPN